MLLVETKPIRYKYRMVMKDIQGISDRYVFIEDSASFRSFQTPSVPFVESRYVLDLVLDVEMEVEGSAVSNLFKMGSSVVVRSH